MEDSTMPGHGIDGAQARTSVAWAIASPTIGSRAAPDRRPGAGIAASASARRGGQDRRLVPKQRDERVAVTAGVSRRP